MTAEFLMDQKVKAEGGHKGRAWARAKFPFDHWIVDGRYVRNISIYVHTYAHVCPPRRDVCVSQEGAERTEGVYLLPSESIIAALAGRREEDGDGQTGDISAGLAFMWRPTVELIFTRFGAESPLPPLFLSSSLVFRSTRRRRREFLDSDTPISLFSRPSPPHRGSLLYIGFIFRL